MFRQQEKAFKTVRGDCYWGLWRRRFYWRICWQSYLSKGNIAKNSHYLIWQWYLTTVVQDILDSKYVAMFYFGSSLPQSLRDNPMCIDAQEGGNEMRFINSVSPITPPDITQNATMSTVWCRGEVRTLDTATWHSLFGKVTNGVDV